MLSLQEMQQLQLALEEKYKGWWEPLVPESGKSKILWMIGEVCEVSDIIKKDGNDRIMNDKETREHFLEEMADVLAYFSEVMLCYDIAPDELEESYRKKMEYNMTRWK